MKFFKKNQNMAKLSTKFGTFFSLTEVISPLVREIPVASLEMRTHCAVNKKKQSKQHIDIMVNIFSQNMLRNNSLQKYYFVEWLRAEIPLFKIMRR